MRIIFLLFLFIMSLNSYSQNYQRKINPDRFGFCVSNTFRFFETTDSLFIRMTENLRPNLLRFPGGTGGNFYHIHGPAYGILSSEVDDFYSGNLSRRLPTLKSISRKKNHNHNYIEDFIDLSKRLKTRVLLVANVLTADTSEIISLIQRLEEEDIEIVGIELGNELSNRAYKSKISSVEDYIRLCKKYVYTIRRSYPEIKIGVVAAPIKENLAYRIKDWNRNLAEEDFYDAIIYHSYIHAVDGDSDHGLMINETEYLLETSSKFEMYKKNCLESFRKVFIDNIIEYNLIFDQKDIWITEWNLKMTKTTGNTLLQSLFVAHYLLDIFSNPILDNVKVLSYHNLAGRTVSGDIFLSNEKNGDFLVHSTYYPLSMISKIFEENIYRVSMRRIDDLYVYECFDISGKAQLAYVVNWDNRSPKIELPLFENNTKSDIESFYGDCLSNRADNDGNILHTKKKIYSSEILIEPYSINLISSN